MGKKINPKLLRYVAIIVGNLLHFNSVI